MVPKILSEEEHNINVYEYTVSDITRVAGKLDSQEFIPGF